ncbi:MAG TPA: exodeoxyribonuclease VII small subunit [Bacteroidota bacterium]
MPQKRKSAAPGTIEDALRRLEEIAGLLQESELPLEESLQLYEEGLRLSRLCAERLQEATVTVRRLEKDLRGTLKLISEEPEGEND